MCVWGNHRRGGCKTGLMRILLNDYDELWAEYNNLIGVK
jgi:hypothetical protein